MRHFVLITGACALTVGATLALTGQWPDPGRSLDLLTGRTVTGRTEVALLALLGWTTAVALMLSAAVRALRARWPGRAGPVPAWSLVVLVVGVALLVAGVARHTGYRVCCATPATAQQAADLVR